MVRNRGHEPIELDLDIPLQRPESLDLIGAVGRGLDFRADHAVFDRDDAGNEAVGVLCATGVDQFEVVVVESG